MYSWWCTIIEGRNIGVPTGYHGAEVNVILINNTKLRK
jgi:hypothetical protein